MLKTLGHGAAARSVTFSPDGKMLASTSDDGMVRLWTPEGTLLKTLRGHTAEVRNVSFSPDGKILASGGQDETMRLWDIHTGECLQMLRTKRPYEGMCIQGATGLKDVQRETLKYLGAVD
ncbi:MAG: WD40 repeat domain-containing protein [Sphaerospermopsis kisseleviana]